MKYSTLVLKALSVCGLLFIFAMPTAMAQSDLPLALDPPIDPTGSWAGIAVQTCPTGVAPAACSPFGPAVSLFMTPTILPDGSFVADDTLTLMGPPFGPHTTAHGQWFHLSPTQIVADYVFYVSMSPPDTKTPAFHGFRGRWLAQMDGDDIVGWVNGYLIPGIPATWQSLPSGSFPSIPNEMLPLVTSPPGFFKDPSQCTGPACPLVFKFHLKRVTP